MTVINKWSVLSALKQNYSPGDEDETALLAVCASASEEISVKMKDGADPGDIRLINAAAAVANYRLALRRSFSASQITSFKAGDVTVTKTPQASLDLALDEKNQAIMHAYPLLQDDGFLFVQVDA